MRYRVRDYRVICELHDKQETVLIVAIGTEASSIAINGVKCHHRFGQYENNNAE
jgi:hypothetical protein